MTYNILLTRLAALGLVCGAWIFTVAHGVSSRGTHPPVVARTLHCFLAFGILVPRSGIGPMSPAWQGTFLTTGLPWKSHSPRALLLIAEVSTSSEHPDKSVWGYSIPFAYYKQLWSLTLVVFNSSPAVQSGSAGTEYMLNERTITHHRLTI